MASAGAAGGGGSGTGEDDRSGGGERRYQPNMQGLLQFCADLTKSEDAPGSSEAQAMDEEVGQVIRVLIVVNFLVQGPVHRLIAK